MNDPLLPGPLWMIGCGNMGRAMLDGWIAAGADPAQITVVRPSGRPVGEGIRVVSQPPEDEVPAIVLMAMKPYQLDEVAPTLAPALDPETLLVSVLAGVELASLAARFPTPRNIVRAMPNLPVAIGKGVIGLASQRQDPAARARLTRLMGALGQAEWLDEEAHIDIVTALAGSGPAFLYRFIDALAASAAELGLPEDQALRMGLATVEGAATLASRSDATPRELAAKVTSPNGTTAAGLNVLDEENALQTLVAATLSAARNRGQQLAAAARTPTPTPPPRA